MCKDPVHLPILTRLRIYFVNFVFNGALGMFLFFTFIWLILPTSFFFKYDSVEPVSVPVDISNDHIDMVSNIFFNNTSGDFRWNDVLRCNYELDPEGYFQFVGESNTSVDTSKIMTEPYSAPWKYTGKMPDRIALCQMNSTITRHVFDYIPKKQFVQSDLFIVR